MKRFDNRIKDVMEEAMKEHSLSASFEFLWNRHTKNREKLFGLRRPAAVLILALIILIALPTMGFACYSIKQVITEKMIINDKREILHMMKDSLNAYNSSDWDKLAYYFSPTLSSIYMDGSEFSSRVLAPPGIPLNSEKQAPSISLSATKVELGDIKLYDNCAVANMYVDGSIYIPSKGELKGPWRETATIVKQYGRWMFASLHWSKLEWTKLKYLAQLPDDYNKDPNKKWPLIVFLHDGNATGTDLELLKAYTLPKLAEAQKSDFPFIVISPQCPDYTWDRHTYALNKLLDEVISKYNIDTDRIYLTGQGSGGMETWNLAETHPERFAAIAPVSGWGDPSRVDSIKNIPVWAFHGDQDKYSPIFNEEKNIDELKSQGGKVTYTVYKNKGYEINEEVYNHPELYSWFLQHKREEIKK